MITVTTPELYEDIINMFLSKTNLNKRLYFNDLISDALKYNEDNLLGFEDFLADNPEYKEISTEIIAEVTTRITRNPLNYTDLRWKPAGNRWVDIYIYIDYDFNLKDIAKEVMAEIYRNEVDFVQDEPDRE